MSELDSIWDEYMAGCTKKIQYLPPVLAFPLLFCVAFIGGLIVLLFCPIKKM